jgi:hypothetical protein
VTVVDDAGRVIDTCDIGDDPYGYAYLSALLAERATGPYSVGIAADSNQRLVPMLLATAGWALAVTDEESTDDFAERFADESTEETETTPTHRRALGLARALQAGALSAALMPVPSELGGLRPVLAAHGALATGRHAAAVALREVLRELYPAALRAYPDPADPVALAVMDALPEPGTLASPASGRGRDAAAAADAVTTRLAAAGIADQAAVTEAITALRVAIAETPRRGAVSKALTATIAETVRQAVAAVRACDAASTVLVNALAERITPAPPAAAPPSPVPPAPAPPRAAPLPRQVPRETPTVAAPLPARAAPPTPARAAPPTPAAPLSAPAAPLPAAPLPARDAPLPARDAPLPARDAPLPARDAPLPAPGVPPSVPAAPPPAVAAPLPGRASGPRPAARYAAPAAPPPRTASAPAASPPSAPSAPPPAQVSGVPANSRPVSAPPPPPPGITPIDHPRPPAPPGGRADQVRVPAPRPSPDRPPSGSGWSSEPPVGDWPAAFPSRQPRAGRADRSTANGAVPTTGSGGRADPRPERGPERRTGAVVPPWRDEALRPPEPPVLRLVEPGPPEQFRDGAGYSGRPESAPLRLVEPNGIGVPRSVPPVSADDDDSLLIFAATRSAWFDRDDDASWNSAMDLGWEAAGMAANPTVGDRTGAGLPRRVPHANLVPGAPPKASNRPLRVVRDPATIAAHTSGYFDGWRRGQEVGGYPVGTRQGRRAAGAWEFRRDDDRMSG